MSYLIYSYYSQLFTAIYYESYLLILLSLFTAIIMQAGRECTLARSHREYPFRGRDGARTGNCLCYAYLNNRCLSDILVKFLFGY